MSPTSPSLNFLLGALFAYGISFKTITLMHISSFTIFFAFTYTYFAKFVFIPDIRKIVIIICIMTFEYHSIGYMIRHQVIRILGTLLILLGYFMSMYSILYLRLRGKKYVYSGPYKLMRHPEYFGMFVCVLGSGIYTSLVLSSVATLFLMKDEFIEMILCEECEMVKEDENYKKYRSTVKMFYFC